MKSNLYTNFATCQLFLDFSDKIVRHNNLSAHVQQLNAQCESSRIQIRQETGQLDRFLSASDCRVTIESYISDEIYSQNLSRWCRSCHRKSSQCSWRICLNGHRLTTFIHVSNCSTIRIDLVHMVEFSHIAHGTSGKSRRRSWIRKYEDVEQLVGKTGDMIYVSHIAGPTPRKMLRPLDPSLR